MIPHIPTPHYVVSGPWEDEPNLKVWKQAGFRCCVLRSSAGHLNGYVGVPQGHGLYGKELSSRVFSDGAFLSLDSAVALRFPLTFAEVGVDGNYWFGFSADGFSPAIGGDPDYYVTFSQVEDMVSHLALALRDLPDLGPIFQSLREKALSLPSPEREVLLGLLQG